LSRLLASRGGFTYISALIIVMVMGIMLGAVGQSMRLIMQREREKELIFRGLQYRDAIERWYTRKGVASTPLNDISALLKDPRTPSGERLLRKLYLDPISGKEFKPIKDPNRGITGVQSTSDAEPLKKANFPEELKGLEEKKKYSEWKFEYKPSQAVPGAPAGTAPGATGTATRPFPLSTPEGP